VFLIWGLISCPIAAIHNVDFTIKFHVPHTCGAFFVGKHLDILAISCDSFNEGTNFTIGRCQGSKNHLSSLKTVQSWCKQYQVAFKINTVVNTHNVEENMAEEILELNPIRWKVRYQNGHTEAWLLYGVNRFSSVY
jgi:hypothetical protein